MNGLHRFARFLFDTPPRIVFLRALQRILQPQVMSEDFSQFDWADMTSCVFFLSTGRVGTQTLASLFAQVRTLYSYHEPHPLLYGVSQQAYRTIRSFSEVDQLLTESFIACRQDLLLRAWQHERGYLESSPQVTFLAPVIHQLLPQTQFIHVIRNPGDVIRSAMRRGWYDGHSYDRTRISPRSDDPLSECWSSFTPFQKNVWLWSETNQWIADFCETLPPEQRLLLRSEDIFASVLETIEQLFAFLNQPTPIPKTIQRILGQQLNAQTSGNFPLPENWSTQMQEQFYSIAGNTADRLGYLL